MGAWTEVARGLWVADYEANGAPIQMSAVDMGDGGLLVVSPGQNVEDAVFNDLDALGTLKAMVSPGAFHHLGMPEWHKRYPDVPLFGPSGAAEHIAKQQPTLPPIRPLTELDGMLSDEFTVGDLEGAKFPDLFMVLRRDGDTTWWSNEVIGNMKAPPSNPIFRFLFWVTGNPPGLNINTFVMMLIKARKPEIRAFLERAIEEHPPTRLVPCHGGVLEDEALAERLSRAVAQKL